MKPSFVLFLNHRLCLILSREEKRGRYGLMTHMARKSGLGILHFGAFVKLGGKMTACYSWLHKSSLGKIPMAQFCGHCLYTESTHACHSVVRGFTGMDICVGFRHLLPIRLLVLPLG